MIAKKVLIVDDCPFFRQTLKDLLQGDFTVVAANSGEQAVKLLQGSFASSAPYDLVITDHNMPGMSGFEVAEFVRGKNREHRFTPVIMLTEMDISAEEARSHGCAALVAKTRMAKIKNLAKVLIRR